MTTNAEIYSLNRVSEILSGSQEISRIVRDLLPDTVSDEDRVRCRKCAAYLLESGFLDDCVIPILDASDHPDKWTRRKMQQAELKSHAKKAVEQLQAVEILPTGLLWFTVVRWFVMPFLRELILRWVFGDDDD